MKMSICHMLFVTFLILAKFYNAGRNFLIWHQCNVTQPKKEILFSAKIEIFRYTKFQKRKFLCRSLNFGRNYRGQGRQKLTPKKNYYEFYLILNFSIKFIIENYYESPPVIITGIT